MTLICKRPGCGGKVKQWRKEQAYCSRQCASQELRPWEKAVATRKQGAGKRRRERIETTPKEELEKVGYAKGYQAARYHYHYRTFLKKLSALLAADASVSEARPETR